MRRVAITGLGVVSPIGIGRKEFAESLRAARSGVVHVPELAELDARCQVAALVPSASARGGDDEIETPPELRFALGAAAEALEDASLAPAEVGPERIGVNLAGCGGPVTRGFHLGRSFSDGALYRRRASRIPTTGIPVMPAAHVAIRFGLRGRVAATNAACTGGLVAIGQAYEWIAAGVVDVCLAGGTDVFDPFVEGLCFETWRALPPDSNGDPPGACRPFDRSRSGFVLGEGAAIFVLEALDHAAARGAPAAAEILGFAAANDGADIKRPTGDGLRRCVDDALRQGRERGMGAVDYVNPHGAGTKIGDPCEIAVLRAALERPPFVSSIKPLCGHGLGACGAIELAAAFEMLRGGFVTPTLNLKNLDPECDGVEHVTERSRSVAIESALSTNMGLGGTNAALAMRRIG